MRRYLPGLLTLALMLGAGVCADAGTTRLTVNGRPVSWPDAVLVEDGHALLPESLLRRRLGLVVERQGEAPRWVVRGFGVAMAVTPGKRGYAVGAATRTGAVAPRVVDGRLYVPAEAVCEVFSLQCRLPEGGGLLELTAPGSRIAAIRHGEEPARTRLVLDLEGPTPFFWDAEGGSVLIQIPPPSAGWGERPLLEARTFGGTAPCVVTRSQAVDGFSSVEIEFRGEGEIHVSTLSEPARIVVDLLRSLPAAPESPPSAPAKPAVEGPPIAAADTPPWTRRQFTTARGPVRVWVLEVDPRTGALEVAPALAGATVHERAGVSRIAVANGAIAAINGGFFAAGGAPLGWLVIDGRWIRAPLQGRTAIGFWPDGTVRMGAVEFAGGIRLPDGTVLALEGLNENGPSASGVMLYTRHWGRSLPGSVSKTYVVLNDEGGVMLVERWGRPLELPSSGFVLAACGRSAAALGNLQRGDRVVVDLATRPAWDGVRHALGAGPRLVVDGKPQVSAVQERFRPDVNGGPRPRSAIGFTERGAVLLVAAEPAAPGVGGVTLDELAAIMVKLGASQAMNLDGGGSTTAVAGGGKVINAPSDGAPRTVSNALVVVPAARWTTAQTKTP